MIVPLDKAIEIFKDCEDWNKNKLYSGWTKENQPKWVSNLQAQYTYMDHSDCVAYGYMLAARTFYKYIPKG